MPNLTLLLVYSWPGCGNHVSSCTTRGFRYSSPYVDLGVIRQRSKSLVQSLVHLLGITFEETTTTYCYVSLLVPLQYDCSKLTTDEKGVSSEDDLFVAILE
jgi:hypothetical protein